MPQITETIIDGEDPVVGAKVRVRPWPGPVAYDTANDDTIVGGYDTVTDAQGVWTATLPACDNLSPTGTVYLVQVTRSGYDPTVRYIDVPDGAGPYTVVDILTDAPGTVASSALQAHVDDTSGAHAASAISFAPTGTIAATTVQAAIAEVASEGGGGGVTDHGALTGLGDDDHTQYALADGSRGTFEVAGAVATHSADTTSVHGIADTSALLDSGDIGTTVAAQSHVGAGGGAHANVVAAGDAGFMTGADKSKLDGIESGADVTDATNVNAAGAVMESDYDAHTILAATTDNTPVALTVAEDRVVGRVAAGNIAALTGSQVAGLVQGTLDSRYVSQSTFDANTIVKADSDNTPVALTVAEQRIVGRVTGGSIDDLTNTQVFGILGTGTPSASTYLRGDGSWQTPAGGGGMTTHPLEANAKYGIPGATLTGAQGTVTLSSNARTHYSFFLVQNDVTITGSFATVSTSQTGATVYFGIVRLDADWQPNSTGLVNQSSFSAASTGVKEVGSLSWALTAGELYAVVWTTDVANVAMRGWYWGIPGLPQGHAAEVNFAANQSMRNNHISGGGGTFSNPVPDWNTTSAGPMQGTGFYHPIIFTWTEP